KGRIGTGERAQRQQAQKYRESNHLMQVFLNYTAYGSDQVFLNEIVTSFAYNLSLISMPRNTSPQTKAAAATPRAARTRTPRVAAGHKKALAAEPVTAEDAIMAAPE